MVFPASEMRRHATTGGKNIVSERNCQTILNLESAVVADSNLQFLVEYGKNHILEMEEKNGKCKNRERDNA